MHQKFSQKASKNPSSTRSVQNTLGRLSDNGLIIKLPKHKESPTYTVEYQILFLLAQQRINEDFIKLNLDIMQIKAKLYKRKVNYERSKVEIDNLTFTSGLRFEKLRGIQISDITEIAEVESIEQEIEQKLDSLFKKIRLTNNQKSILRENFLDLKESYQIQNKEAFNAKFKDIKGLGRKTKQALLKEWGNK